MARLQILQLPEGVDDNRPPFVLVVDQYVERRYITGLDQPEPVSEFDGIAERIGARAVLVFEGETVEIPANDTSAYLARTEEQAESERVSERALQAEEKLNAFMDKRYRIESERKAALLDALGMDQTRDWDDILNAARGLREQMDAMRERDANTS
ncbi:MULTISPECIES: hypothetical protein [Streptomyces]|uniref:hypothetical protein n=1 Tax=Streptomyces althioticus TaxID=83380 RepID=UPI0033D04BB4